MELRQLATFVAVARVLSFTRAAARLNYAQSSVTAHVRALEQSVGTPLFERIGKGVQLTAAGERLLVYADRILELREEAYAAVQPGPGGSGRLVVGTVESLTTYRLVPVLADLERRYPELELSLRPGLGAATQLAVQQGSCDLAFLIGVDTDYPNLTTQILFSEPLMLVAAPGHRLVGKATLSLDDLREEHHVVTQSGCGYHDLFCHILRRVQPSLVCREVGPIEAVKRSVALGLGISVLPAFCVEAEVAAGTLVALPWHPPFQLYTHLCWHRKKFLSPTMQVFIDFVIRRLGDQHLAWDSAALEGNRSAG